MPDYYRSPLSPHESSSTCTACDLKMVNGNTFYFINHLFARGSSRKCNEFNYILQPDLSHGRGDQHRNFKGDENKMKWKYKNKYKYKSTEVGSRMYFLVFVPLLFTGNMITWLHIKQTFLRSKIKTIKNDFVSLLGISAP